MRELSLTRKITYTALAVALIALGAVIHIPGAVPITLQLFTLFFVLFLFGGAVGSVSSALYVFMGAIGLPVFSGFTGGFGRLFDASGGYIVAFLPCALVYLAMSGRNNKRRILSAAVSLAVLYISALLWYTLVYLDGGAVWYAFLTFVAPYIIPDLLKVVLAYIIALRLEKYVLMKVR